MCSLFSQDIKTGFFGGGGALLPDGLVRLRAVVLANEMRGRKEGLCSREGGGIRATGRTGCSLPSYPAVNLSSHAFRGGSAATLPCACSASNNETEAKADPRRWFAYPQIFDANETSSFEIRQRTTPSETKAWKEGREGG